MSQQQTPEYHLDDEIDLSHLFRALWQGKYHIVAITMIITCLTSIGAYLSFQMSNTAKTIISFDYDGILEGKNPDGSAFVGINLVESNVLTETYKGFPILIEKNISLQKMQEQLKIEGMISEAHLNSIEKEIQEGKVSSYIPSKYAIYFNLTTDEQLDREILSSLIDSYIESYKVKYKEGLVLPQLQQSDFIEYDFLESLDWILYTVELAKSKIELNIGKGFHSHSTGLTFEDTLFMLDNLVSLDINKLREEIEDQNLSKRVSKKVLQLNYKLRALRLNKDKNEHEQRVLEKMLADYKPGIRNMVVPSLGEMGIKISTEEEYYTNLINDYKEVRIIGGNLAVDIKEVNRQLNEITEIPEDKRREVDMSIEQVASKVNSLLLSINIMNDEYQQQKHSDMLKRLIPVHTVNDSKPVLLVALGTLLGLMFGVFYVLARNAFSGKNRDEEIK